MTRDADIRAASHVPYRLLETDGSQDGGNADPRNMLIQGDNLDALKALLPYYAGSVKCIYIDPPYNTKSAFEHYDDNLEHSQWLAMMYPRLVLLRDLLADDGSIWVSIDDNEGHYLKVIMDEVFGRRKFISEIIWQKRTSRENRAVIGSAHDAIMAYSKKEPNEWKKHRNLLPPNTTGFSNPDNDSRGIWRSIPFSAQGYRANQMYVIAGPNGEEHTPPPGRCWGATEEVFNNLKKEGRVYFPKNGAGKPRIKQFAGEESGLVPMSLWTSEEAGTTEQSKKEIIDIFEGNIFATPKPERLIQRILHIATNSGDLVLDSFLGSGTTAAVAHKMGRRWIGIEMGDHAVTHCKPRMDKVIAGEQGGISKSVEWQGGGGYRFWTLGAPVFDEDGRITPDIRFPTLAAHIWFSETGTPYEGDGTSPVLGTHEGVVYALLYNGILGDRKPRSGNVLTNALLQELRQKAGGWQEPMVIYGESSRLGSARLADEQITFRQTPYDVRAR